MRIMFVLKVQSALYPFQNTFLNRFFKMNFRKYSLDETTKLAKLRKKLWQNARVLFTSSQEQAIKLSDPQKRLEDSFNEMARQTSDQIKSIRFGFSNQISDTESRLYNNQRRIIDSIIDLSNKNNEKIAELKRQTQLSDEELKIKINETQKQIEQAIVKFSMRTNDDFKHTHTYFNTQMSDTEHRILSLSNKLQSILIGLGKKNLFQFESMKHYWINQSKNLKSVILSSQKLVEESFVDLERNNRQDIEMVQKKLNDKIEDIDSSLKNIERNFVDLLSQMSSEFGKNLFHFKENYENQIRNLRVSMNESNEKVNQFIKELNDTVQFEFKSNKVATNFFTLQLSNLEAKFVSTTETIARMNESLNALNMKIEMMQMQ